MISQNGPYYCNFINLTSSSNVASWEKEFARSLSLNEPKSLIDLFQLSFGNLFFSVSILVVQIYCTADCCLHSHAHNSLANAVAANNCRLHSPIK